MNWVQKHSKTLTFIGGTIAAGYMLSKLMLEAVLDFHSSSEREKSARADIKQRFEQNLLDCQFVISSLLPVTFILQDTRW